MEHLESTAPPVVAVMVVHEPDAVFQAALEAVSAQQYPDLRVLLLVTGGDEELSQVRHVASARCPQAVVRSLDGNPGWGPACNVGLDLVEGDRGLFLLIHDDTALEAGALRRLVEELYRSNAGIVGPKLVEWDDPRRLQRVGLDVDRGGDIDPRLESGELDQEQHDAVCDMFALPSACLLIRADLLRLLRLDDGIDFHGDDVDLCWRAHLTGARVLLVPGARARHRGRLPERRPDLDHRRLMAQHRVWSVVTLTGARRLPAVLVWLILVTFAELVTGLVARRPRAAWSMVVALVGVAVSLPRVLARRRAVRPLRLVPEDEIASLQIRGSARLRRYRRSRQAAVRQGSRSVAAPLSSATVLTWLTVLAFVAVGSRRLILDGVAPVGEMLALSTPPTDLLEAYMSPAWGQGLGGGDAAPTGWALVGVAGALLGSRTGLLHSLSVMGVVVVGLVGLWHLGARLGSVAGRRACVLGGLVVPFAAGAIGTGRWSALLLWAATPWWVESIVAAGEGTPGRALRRIAAMVLSVALVAAFVPGAVIMVVVIGLFIGLATIGGHERGWWAGVAAAARGVGLTIIAGVGAAVIHLPWSWSFITSRGWNALWDPVRSTPGWWNVAQWGRAGTALSVLTVGVVVPALVSALITRGRWSVWGLRAAVLLGACALVAVAVDRTVMPMALGDPWWWLGPAAVGAALGVGTLAAAWRDDVATRHFGWRQPLGLLAAATVVAAALPALLSVVDGRWQQPRSSLAVLLRQLPTDTDHRVVIVGDRRVVPTSSWPLAEGLGFSVLDRGELTLTSTRWLPPAQAAIRSVQTSFESIGREATPRLGRLLAPVGVRFIVVPLIDGVVSTADDPVPAPVGLLERLGDQVDLRRRSGTADLVIYENLAWLPVKALVEGPTAAATQQAGGDALVEVDLVATRPVIEGLDPWTGGSVALATSPGSVLHLGVPRSAGWQLTIDGRTLPSRPSFGTVTAWDLPAAASLVVTLEPPRSLVRWVVVAVQALVWSVLALVAIGVRVGSPRRRRVES